MSEALPIFASESVWAIEAMALARLAAAVESLGPEAARVPRELQPDLPLSVEGRTAVISVMGVLTRRPSVFTWISGGTATQQIEQAVERARVDASVSSIALLVDSPGGSVGGIHEASEAVARAAREKPTVAIVQGIAASAAYWLISGAGKIMASSPLDLIGSVGARLTVVDSSESMARRGLKVYSFDTGPLKSAGVDGIKLTEAHRQFFQGVVDKVQAAFLAAIQRGRRLSPTALEAVATGEVFVGADATAKGLVDGLATVESVLARLSAGEDFSRVRSENVDTNNNAASLAELRSIPGVEALGAEFLLAQAEGGATLAEATRATARALADRLKASGNTPGHRRVGLPDTEENLSRAGAMTGDAIETFSDAIAERMKSGMSRRDALRAVAAENPELHWSFVAATNPNKRRVQDLIEERFS
ncbi:MAG: S49 family peptidase [Pirellulales bacterium]|nr:S49 family peptidase [Pirellulales bacterium]